MPFHVIPAIDLLDGKVVRLHQGDYKKATIYSDDLLPIATQFKEAGFNHIHIVDLNGAKEGRFVNLQQILEVKESLGISVQTGGGVRSISDIELLLESGINRVICTSMAVEKEDEWFTALQRFGGERCILGLDIKDGKIAYGGWLKTIKEPVNQILERHINAGVKTILSTDISKDGTLEGPNQELYLSLQKEFPTVEIIASGGVANKSDLLKLKENKFYGCVVGRAFYENQITLEDMMDVHSAEY
jgi:phosphoribosylformimino-5-aminoimidazole carboxamide ribotide isomerase